MKCKFYFTGTLDKKLVEGKIVLCDTVTLGDQGAQLAAGAVGTIMQVVSNIDVAFSFPLPTSCLSLKNGSEVKDYYNSSRYNEISLQVFSNIVAYNFVITRHIVCTKLITSLIFYVLLITNRTTTTTIQKSTEENDELALYVASFSSRGPNPITRNILKVI